MRRPEGVSSRDLFARLDAGMLSDRARLLPRVERLARGARPSPDDPELRRLREELDRSAGRVEERRRAAGALRLAYDQRLPVVAAREEIAAALRDHQVVVVCGQTGSGKTTQLPKVCLELGRGLRGMIGHTQPRRIAARSVAARVAEELGVPLGREVGFKVRFDDQASAATLVKVMTDGLLLAETQQDRLLLAYDTLIIDEAHERSLNIDFLLGYVKRLIDRGERPDLKVVITSATIDPERFAEHFAAGGNKQAVERGIENGERTEDTGSVAGAVECTPIIDVSGRTYPVEVRYRPLVCEDGERDDLEVEEAVVRAVDEFGLEDIRRGAGGAGDILVFLPGEREIRETAELLGKHLAATGGGMVLGRRTEVIPLYARLSGDEQQRVFRAHQTRRVVLATNVAETSLTVPGIRYVIDTGLARIGRYSPRTKVQRLPIEAISRASAEQRKGRCGREEPGVCIRLYAESDYAARPEFTEPEILRTNLASVILQMKALRLGAIEEFPFVEPPDPRMVRDGYETLQELGAVDERYEITELGRRLARLPIDPRIGRMVLAAEREGSLREVLVIAAALSSQDPRERGRADQPEVQQRAAEAHARFSDPSSDFLGMLKLWNAFHERAEELSGSRLRKWCKEHFVSFMRVREWQDVHRQLERVTAEMGIDDGMRGTGVAGKGRRVSAESVHRALLAGLLSNIGRKSERPSHWANPGAKGSGEGNYDGVRGLKFDIFPGSVLFKSGAKWVMSGEIVRTTRTYARTAAAVDPAWIEGVAGGLVKTTHHDPEWDAGIAESVVYERVTLFGLEIVKRRRVRYGPIDPAHARSLFIHHALVNGEYLTGAPFFMHNHELVREIAALENKARRRGLAADQAALHAFYDRRLAPEVYSGPAFERWRRRAESREPRLLFMSVEDVLVEGDDQPTPEKYPDVVLTEGLRLPVRYVFAPGEKHDGVNVEVAYSKVREFDPRPLEWLVPGMLKEKVIELIRTLPKHARVAFVPVPTYAEQAIAAMSFGKGDLLSELASVLGRLKGMQVSREMFKPEALPAHLSVYYRVLDDAAGVARGPDGSPPVLAEGRAWEQIRAELNRRTARAMAGLGESRLNRGGLMTWAFDDPPGEVLPESVEVENRTVNGVSGRILVYPAIVEEPGANGKPSAAVRLFDTLEKARAASRRGLRRLVVLQLEKTIGSLIANTPGVERLYLAYASLGGPEQLRGELTEVIADKAIGELSGGVRDRAQFDAVLDYAWSRLGRSAEEAMTQTRTIVQERNGLLLALGGAVTGSGLRGTGAAMAADLGDQLAWLCPAGFLTSTPARWFNHLPRYLEGMRLRMEKALREPPESMARDERLLAEVLPWWRACKELLAPGGEGVAARRFEEPRAAAAVDELRWMIEEYRVSLFAQELRTALPVSVKRLSQQWEKIQRALGVPVG